MSELRLIDANALCKEFKERQRAAINWKEQAILYDNEESKIRADAILTFLSEVKLTIDKAPTVEAYNTDSDVFNYIFELREKYNIEVIISTSRIDVNANKYMRIELIKRDDKGEVHISFQTHKGDNKRILEIIKCLAEEV